MINNKNFWIGGVVSAVFITFFLFSVDIAEMEDALSNARYQYIVPGVFIYGASLIFRTLRWRYLLSSIVDISFSRLFPVVSVGYMANNLLPARLGEFVRAYYLSARERCKVSSTLATIVVERIYDGLTLVLMAVLAAPVLIFSGLVDGSGIVTGLPWVLLGVSVAILFIVAIVILTLMASNLRFRSYVEKLADILPTRFKPRTKEFLRFFIEGLVVLREPRMHMGLSIRSVPVWLLEASVYVVIAFSFDLPSHFSPAVYIIPVMIVVTAVSNLGTALPSAPGALGTFEVPALAALALVGVGEGLAGAFVLVLHASLLIPSTALGLLFLWMNHISLGNLLRAKDVNQ